jgi:hypothetical protein
MTMINGRKERGLNIRGQLTPDDFADAIKFLGKANYFFDRFGISCIDEQIGKEDIEPNFQRIEESIKKSQFSLGSIISPFNSRRETKEALLDIRWAKAKLSNNAHLIKCLKEENQGIKSEAFKYGAITGFSTATIASIITAACFIASHQ